MKSTVVTFKTPSVLKFLKGLWKTGREKKDGLDEESRRYLGDQLRQTDNSHDFELPAPVCVSARAQDWLDFSFEVLKHIEKYTVPQYGDKPNDAVEDWTAEDCIKAVKKYSSRFGKNMRKGQQELDFLKIAHFAQLAAMKYEEEKKLK